MAQPDVLLRSFLEQIRTVISPIYDPRNYGIHFDAASPVLLLPGDSCFPSLIR